MPWPTGCVVVVPHGLWHLRCTWLGPPFRNRWGRAVQCGRVLCLFFLTLWFMKRFGENLVKNCCSRGCLWPIQLVFHQSTGLLIELEVREDEKSEKLRISGDFYLGHFHINMGNTWKIALVIEDFLRKKNATSKRLDEIPHELLKGLLKQKHTEVLQQLSHPLSFFDGCAWNSESEFKGNLPQKLPNKTWLVFSLGLIPRIRQQLFPGFLVRSLQALATRSRWGVAVYHSDAMCDHVFERCLSDGWHCTTLCCLDMCWATVGWCGNMRFWVYRMSYDQWWFLHPIQWMAHKSEMQGIIAMMTIGGSIPFFLSSFWIISPTEHQSENGGVTDLIYSSQGFSWVFKSPFEPMPIDTKIMKHATNTDKHQPSGPSTTS